MHGATIKKYMQTYVYLRLYTQRQSQDIMCVTSEEASVVQKAQELIT